MQLRGKFLLILFFLFLIKYSFAVNIPNKVFFVSVNGSDTNSGLSFKYPLKSLQGALDKAMPGDKIVLLKGDYYENIHSVRSGLKNKPICIIGTIDSKIFGNYKSGGRIIEINHSYINLLNLNIDGKFKDSDTLSSYHDKLIYVKGKQSDYLKGIIVKSSNLKNAWGECLRIKFTKDSEISFNKISNCGVRDFKFDRGKQNGEGIYIGTAPEQMAGAGLDKTNNLVISSNIIATNAAECVDVKEGAYNIKITDNVCYNEKAEKVGGISIRGNRNEIINNILFNNEGAGIRLGGDTKEYGIFNKVISNYLDTNKFALKIMAEPQKKNCGNIVSEENNKKIYPDNITIKGFFKRCK